MLLLRHDFARLLEPKANKVLLVLNNEHCVSLQLLNEYWRACPFRVCADGAANWLFANQLWPDVLCGDLDSISPEVLHAYKTSSSSVELVHNAGQDDNDMEKCLQWLQQQQSKQPPEEIELVVLGAFGGRFDHEMANINASFGAAGKFSRCVLVSDGNVGEVLVGHHTHELEFADSDGKEGVVCGLLPIMGACQVHHTLGLKYNVCANQELRFGGLISTSNQVVSPLVTISLQHSATPVLFTCQLL